MQPILTMQGVNKYFPGVHALKDMQFDLLPGEAHALLGENGAGKSTLIKILGGIHPIDAGEIRIDDEPIRITSVQDAQSRGIAIIHQELCLVPHMTISENIFLGREQGGGFLKSREMDARASELLGRVGLQVPSTAKVRALSVAQQQMVEIAKALSQNARILVMDEPTATLTTREVEMLFEVINQLRAQGISIIYISHRLDELFRVCDRVTVMRDGGYIGTRVIRETTREELIRMMVGRALSDLYARSARSPGEVVLSVSHLNVPGVLKDICFELRRGEILGLSGLVGAGRTELAQALFGIREFAGEIRMEGAPFAGGDPLSSMRSGLALVPENRKEQGLVLIRGVDYNITLPVVDRFMRWFGPDRASEDAFVDSYITKLGIRTPGREQLVKNLSGGNQQKVVISKWLGTEPKVLILDEPTRGVDVGAKAEIYQIMDDLAKSGMAILMISSELPEIIGMCDRVLVMCRGELKADLSGDGINQETIMHFATGGDSHDVA